MESQKDSIMDKTWQKSNFVNKAPRRNGFSRIQGLSTSVKSLENRRLFLQDADYKSARGIRQRLPLNMIISDIAKRHDLTQTPKQNKIYQKTLYTRPDYVPPNLDDIIKTFDSHMNAQREESETNDEDLEDGCKFCNTNVNMEIINIVYQETIETEF